MARNALGVYIFAGGFTLGVSKHFRVVAHLEGSNYGVPTFRKNFPYTPVWQHRATWPLKWLKGQEIEFVYANPPCAAWSMAGKTLKAGRSSWISDERVNCVHHVFEVLEALEPTVLVWESVTQAYTRAPDLLRALRLKAKALGYSTTFLFMSAFSHGIPQPRRRFMMFCHKVKLDLPYPNVQPRSPSDALGLRLEDGEWRQDCPVWGVPDMDPLYHRLARATPPGESLLDVWEEINEGDPAHWDLQAPMFFAVRLALDGIGYTQTSQISHVHPVWNRWLADSEVARLCGWPDDYTWVHQHDGPIRNQITQAVLPPVGDWVGEVVNTALERNEPESGEFHVIDHLSKFGLHEV